MKSALIVLFVGLTVPSVTLPGSGCPSNCAGVTQSIAGRGWPTSPCTPERRNPLPGGLACYPSPCRADASPLHVR